MNSSQVFSTEVFEIIAAWFLEVLVGMMMCLVVRSTAFTDQSDLDVTEPDELQDQTNASYSTMTECLIPEEEQGTEGTTHVLFSFPSELHLIKPCLHEPGVVEPFENTIIPQNEPFPCCSEKLPPVTLGEPDDVSRLAELSEENLLPTCLDGCYQPIDADNYPGSISPLPLPTDASCYPSKQNEDESAVAQNIFQKQADKEMAALPVPKTCVMMTHSTNAANSFQKLLQFAMSQDPSPSETDATETATQPVAAESSSTNPETTPDSGVVGNQKRKGKNKNKKNKRKGRNGKN